MLAALAMLGGCAVLAPREEAAPEAPPLSDVPRFSTERAGGPLSRAWQAYSTLPTKRPTVYEHVKADASTVLRARTGAGGATGLYVRVDIDPAQRGEIAWSWRTARPIAGADVSDFWADDSVGRIVLTFEGDAEKFSLHDKLLSEQAKLFTGRALPYATLMYVWDARLPVETMVRVEGTSRVVYIVCESGDAGVGRWRSYRRNVVEDFRRAFGEEPGRITAVGLIADTDDTRESVETLFGDIELLPSRGHP